jgi:competence protein ComEA
MAALSSPPQADDTHRYLEDVLGDESTSPSTPWLWIAIVAVILLALAFSLGAYAERYSTKPAPIGPFEGEGASVPSTLVVHVVGQVNKPGVYNFPFDARVRDAIQKAGGPKKSADLNAINLAAWLEDGTQIVVPSKSTRAATMPDTTNESTPALPEASAPPLPEYSPPAFTQELPQPVPQSTPRPAEKKTPKAKAAKVLPDVPRETTKSGAESQNADPKYLEKNQINLNTATAEQLELLPNVGPALAQKIVDYRQQNGPFKSVDELDNVSGIGEKTLEKLRPLVTIQ